MLSYDITVHLLQLRKQHWYITINWTQQFIQISWVFPQCSSVPGSHLGYHITLNHYVSIAFSGLWQFLRIFLSLMTWNFWGAQIIVFSRTQFGCVQCLSHVSTGGLGLGERYYRSEVPFSCQEDMLSTWLITVEMNLDHLNAVMFSKSLYCRVIPTPQPFPNSTLWKQVTKCNPHRMGLVSLGSSKIRWRGAKFHLLEIRNIYMNYIEE